MRFPGLSINGFTNSSNAGIVFAALKSFDERKHRELERRRDRRAAQPQFAAIQDAFIAIFPPPPVNGLGTTGGFKLYLEDRALARLRGARRRDQGVPREGLPDARARGSLLELPGERAAALRRRRPHQGAPARRAGDRRVRHHADLPRQSVRERLQQVRAHLLGARAGRRAVPRARRGCGAAQGALELGRDGAALGADEGEAERRDPSAPSATTASSPPTSTGARARASPRARRRTRSSASPPRRCRRASATTGPTSRTRRSSPATRRVWVYPLAILLVFLVLAALYESLALPARDHPHRADEPAAPR